MNAVDIIKPVLEVLRSSTGMVLVILAVLTVSGVGFVKAVGIIKAWFKKPDQDNHLE